MMFSMTTTFHLDGTSSTFQVIKLMASGFYVLFSTQMQRTKTSFTVCFFFFLFPPQIPIFFPGASPVPFFRRCRFGTVWGWASTFLMW